MVTRPASTILIEDARQGIFAVFSLPVRDGKAELDSRRFLGTGFFVSRHGHAMTAAHVLPHPQDVAPDEWIAAALVHEGREVLCKVLGGAVWPKLDLSLFQVGLGEAVRETQYLNLAGVEAPSGTDVEVIGVTEHEVWGGGKEMRILKGHVSMTLSPWLELSCPVPSGMSGSPVLAGGRVVGCAVGQFRSEQVEDFSEERREIDGANQVVRVTVIRRLIEYGRAVSFALAAASDDPPIHRDRALLDFVAQQNTA
jgi:hypothetical protein